MSSIRVLVLLNLGTPASPAPDDVKAYLGEFLMDPFVIDIPYIFRWLLVHGSILRTRPETSAAAYRKVWSKRGSPLLFHLLDLASATQRILGEGWKVIPAMRYGSPSLAMALEEIGKLAKETEIVETVLFPLYPQYSLAATESSIQSFKELASAGHSPLLPEKFRVIGPFYDHPAFISAFAEIAQRSLEEFRYDFVLFSFHGLPVRQIKRVHAGCLNNESCCATISDRNRNCYRAQCFATARALAQKLGLSEDKWQVSFQSRLGRTPWIEPFTDFVYKKLVTQGVRRLAVMCPAFVADCLETLEEVAIRGREDFIQLGGEDLRLIPSLNSEPAWAGAVAEIVKKGL